MGITSVIIVRHWLLKAAFLILLSIPVQAQVSWTQSTDGCEKSVSAQYVISGLHWAGPVKFTVNPTGMPAGITLTDVQRALDAWVRYAQIDASLEVNFATLPNTVDGVSVISFGAPENAGVLATTYVAARGAEIYDADIVVNSGHDALLSNPCAFASMLCHELGHALGLGHSLDPIAMMRPEAHQPGRDATLAPDDRAAIQFVYEPKQQDGPTVERVKAKALKLTAFGDVAGAVTVWVNGSSYRVKSGTDMQAVIKGQRVSVAKGFNVAVLYSSRGVSDPFFF